ncbi:MAG: triose-phosphate isomerase, partial [Acetobacteraceae bacterium]|nr:triose-phosphate isomerase [Acetobacteraceae bacterium]
MPELAKRKLIIGNWKMNGSVELVRATADEMRSALPELRCELVLCPPSTLVSEAARALVGSPVRVGGQDCHCDSKGPHTGDVSAAMLSEAGAVWVILGHSE